MNKLCKIISIISVFVVALSIAISAEAYTNEDVISYITKEHTVNGRSYRLEEKKRESLKAYLQSNPVSNDEANQIIADLNEAKSLIDNSGATNKSQLSDSTKSKVVSLLKEAGKIADLNIEVDTEKETVTVLDKKGNVVVSATSYAEFNKNQSSKNTSSTNTSSTSSNGSTTSNKKKLVYTGNNSKVGYTILAIVAIAGIGVVTKKYAK